jgi:phage terminase large subunit-like protein
VGNYARAVIKGKIPAGRLVRLACERHLTDCKRKFSPRFPYRFDRAKAAWAIRFFSHLRHSKGEWAGQPFVLEPWQEFIVGSLFGWVKTNGLRRFRNAYTELGRKNGKSTISAGLAILLGFFDGEQGAEIYCAATKRDQAKIVWEEAERMVKSTPALKKRIKVFRGVSNLHSEATASKLEPLGADSDTLDGLNTHGAVIDELHAHKNRRVVDVLETATGARRQPLLFYITTAGHDRHSVCWEHHDYSIKILERVITDERWFGYIATIDEGDKWDNPKVWAKANPNLAVSVKVDDLKNKCAKAKQLPSAQNAFRQKHLDEWTEQAVRWMPMDIWDACRKPRAELSLKGQRCFGGLDLAQSFDITALLLTFPDGDDHDILPRFWIPEENLRERVRRDRVPYDVWARQGFLITTPGNVTDYAFIREEIKQLATIYQLVELGYDPWNATQLALQLQDDGAPMVQFRQGFVSMNEPCKEIERLAVKAAIRHGGNPVLRWMASNVAVRTDPAGNIKIDNEKSTERVDGMVALAMAIGCWLRHKDETPPPSVYKRRGPLVFEVT